MGMAISVTELKHRCLEIVRRVERTGSPVAITRRGKVVAQLRRPALPAATVDTRLPLSEATGTTPYSGATAQGLPAWTEGQAMMFS